MSGVESSQKNIARISSIYSTSNFNTFIDENENKRLNSVVKGSLPFDKSEPFRYVVSIPQPHRAPHKHVDLLEVVDEQQKTFGTSVKEKLLSKNKTTLLKELKTKKNIINKLNKLQANHSFNGSGNYGDLDASHQDANNLNNFGSMNDYANNERGIGMNGTTPGINSQAGYLSGHMSGSVGHMGYNYFNTNLFKINQRTRLTLNIYLIFFLVE